MGKFIFNGKIKKVIDGEEFYKDADNFEIDINLLNCGIGDFQDKYHINITMLDSEKKAISDMLGCESIILVNPARQSSTPNKVYPMLCIQFSNEKYEWLEECLFSKEEYNHLHTLLQEKYGDYGWLDLESYVKYYVKCAISESCDMDFSSWLSEKSLQILTNKISSYDVLIDGTCLVDFDAVIKYACDEINSLIEGFAVPDVIDATNAFMKDLEAGFYNE